jgi:hypothetical protein
MLKSVFFLPSSQDLTFKALLLSMEQVTKYGEMYRAAIVEFKIRHFEDRSKVVMVLIIFMIYVYLILVMLNVILIPYFCFAEGHLLLLLFKIVLLLCGL